MTFVEAQRACRNGLDVRPLFMPDDEKVWFEFPPKWCGEKPRALFQRWGYVSHFLPFSEIPSFWYTCEWRLAE